MSETGYGGACVGQYEKLLLGILNGHNDNNIKFADLQKVLEVNDFQVRIRGDHFIYTRNGIEEIINIQPQGNKAKGYQVKQVRGLLVKYRLEGKADV